MKRIIKILNKIFAPRITSTYYYNDKEVKEIPKEIKDQFRAMKQEMKKFWEDGEELGEK